MKLNRFYDYLKILFLLVHVAMLHAKTHLPMDVENEITLKIKNKDLTYHELDKNGLSYHHVGSEYEIGDSIKVGIYSRTIKSFQGKKKKKFGFRVQVNDEKPIELIYNKDGSNVTSPDRPGWNYTQSGIWFLYLPVKKDGYEITIEPLSKKPIVHVRLVSNVIKKNGKFSVVIKTVNHQKRTKIETKKESNDKGFVSTRWYPLEERVQQQFRIKGPTKVRLFSRISSHDQSVNDYYISIREDGIEIGTFYFMTEASDKSFISSSKIPVSKWRSIWLTVPEGIHVYSISLPNIENNHNHVAFIRLKEWLQE